MREFIVGEVSKNYATGDPFPRPHEALCGLFEEMIEHNRARGYVLHTFSLHQVQTGPTCLSETIIAVFRRTETRPTSLS